MPELKKLQISAYKDEEFSSSVGSPFSVMINPSSYKRNYSINYNEEESEGKAAKSLKFKSYSAETVDIEFILDGTGVVDQSDKSVADRIDDLGKLAYNYNGDIHEPNYVKLKWGTLEFNGRMTKLGIEYTLFKSDGSPLRAKVNISVQSHVSEKKEAKLANNQSPDLTHIITVKEGDSLPLLCSRIYKDSTYYLKVAKINGLTNFRNLKPGSKLHFPPLQ